MSLSFRPSNPTLQTPHAVALVTRIAGASSARAGARATLGEDGTLIEGFLGGGCVTGAVRRAALAALETGQPVLLALRPQAALDALGIAPGETREGWLYARNGCPSEGQLDIFVEPVLPAPRLAILGGGPVAEALHRIARAAGLACTQAAPGTEGCTGFDWIDPATTRPGPRDAIVIATQGAGDRDALRAALGTRAGYLGFVASPRKAAKLRERLRAEGIPETRLALLRAPCGLDLGCEGPDEIALSILAEIIAHRRGKAPT